jgi:hypothetical protein
MNLIVPGYFCRIIKYYVKTKNNPLLNCRNF